MLTRLPVLLAIIVIFKIRLYLYGCVNLCVQNAEHISLCSVGRIGNYYCYLIIIIIVLKPTSGLIEMGIWNRLLILFENVNSLWVCQAYFSLLHIFPVGTQLLYPSTFWEVDLIIKKNLHMAHTNRPAEFYVQFLL